MKATNPAWTNAVSVSVFLFFALMLAVPSGYSYGAALLVCTSIFFLIRCRPLQLSAEDRMLIYALFSVFFVTLVSFFLHDKELRSLDQSSRCLLAIPMVILLVSVPPRASFVWAGLITGTVASACISVWQLHWLGIERATGFVTSAVPFGNLALAMGLLCAVGIFSFPSGRKNVWVWRTALGVGVLAGLYCSVASATRGGWVAIAPVALLLCAAFLNKRNMKRAVVLSISFITLLSALLAIPDSTVRLRYDEAVEEINSYVERHDSTTSIGGRLEVWRAAAINIPKKPILGWGESAYRVEMERLVEQRRLNPSVLILANSHNNFLQVWLFEGIFGLLALLTLYLLPFWSFCRRFRAADNRIRVWAVSGATLVASFFVFSLTLVILGRNSGITFFVVTLAVFWGCMRAREIEVTTSV